MTENTAHLKSDTGNPRGEGQHVDHHVIHYYVDGEPQETQERVLTARQILEFAGFNTSEFYLVEVKGKHQESYADKMDELIHMHEHQTFIAVYAGTTPVS